MQEIWQTSSKHKSVACWQILTEKKKICFNESCTKFRHEIRSHYLKCGRTATLEMGVGVGITMSKGGIAGSQNKSQSFSTYVTISQVQPKGAELCHVAMILLFSF